MQICDSASDSGSTPDEDPLVTAIGLHRAGNIKEAWDLYERYVEKNPASAEGWHFLGLLNFQTGHRDEGIRAVRHCLTINPDYPDAHANLANMLLSMNQTSEAESHLKKALELCPDALPPLITLALILRLTNRAGEAETLLRPRIESHPKHLLLRQAFAKALLAQGRTEEALDHSMHAAALEAESDENDGQSNRLYGYALCKLGRFEEAAKLYRKRLEKNPEDVDARHLLAACGGAETPARAEAAYVRDTFDRFAETFEAQLGRLGYRAPRLIGLAAEQCLRPANGSLDVLDAGCGTGLLGEVLKPWCARLSGVDLSPGMLQRARDRGIYDSVTEGELSAYLRDNRSRYDVVASADTLIYFGAMEEVAANAHCALREDGWLLFTLEDGGDQPEGYKLQFHGRYSHRTDYIVRVLEEAGFRDIRVARADLRTEGGKPVPGLVVAAHKAAQ